VPQFLHSNNLTNMAAPVGREFSGGHDLTDLLENSQVRAYCEFALNSLLQTIMCDVIVVTLLTK
jgi:hypothetical protein